MVSFQFTAKQMAFLRKSPDKEDTAAAAPAISKDSNSGSTAKTVASAAAVPAKSATAAAGLPSSVKLSSEASDTFQKTSAAAAVRIYYSLQLTMAHLTLTMPESYASFIYFMMVYYYIAWRWHDHDYRTIG